jgi:hypothetical protein
MFRVASAENPPPEESYAFTLASHIFYPNRAAEELLPGHCLFSSSVKSMFHSFHTKQRLSNVQLSCQSCPG